MLDEERWGMREFPMTPLPKKSMASIEGRRYDDGSTEAVLILPESEHSFEIEAHLCKEELLALKSEIDKILDWW